MAPASFMERGELTELTKKSGVSSEPGHRKLPPKNGTNPVFYGTGELTELTKKSGVGSRPGRRKLPAKNGTNPVFYGPGELTELTEKIRCKQWAGPPEAPCKKRNKSRALPSGREISLYIPPILEATRSERGSGDSKRENDYSMQAK